MSITVEWDNPEKTIVRVTFAGRWTWAEFYEFVTKQVQPLIRTVDHTVDVISDFRDSGPLPLGPAITYANNVMKSYPPNAGIMVIVSNSLLIKTLVNVFSSAFKSGIGAKTFAVTSLEEAYHLIRQHTRSSEHKAP